MNKNSKQTRLLAVIVVAMFLVSGVVCVTNDSDAASSTTYTVNLWKDTSSSDYTYSYTPGVNLKSGTTVYNVEDSNNLLTVTGNNTSSLTMSFKASEARQDYSTVKLTATWTSADDQTLKQYAYQNLNFKVWDVPYFTVGNTPVSGTQTASVMTGTASGSTITAINVVGSGTTSIESVTVTDSSNQDASQLIKPMISGSGVTLTTGSNSIPEGTYVAKITGKSVIGPEDNDFENQIEKSVTLTYNVVVSDTVAITPTQFYSYYGEDTDNNNTTTTTSRALSFSPDTLESVQYSVTASDNENVIPVGPLSASSVIFKTTGETISGQYKTYNFTIGLTATNGDAQISKTVDATLKMWANLAFTSAPSAGIMTASVVGQDNLKVRTTIPEVSGATEIRYSWGDGKTSIIPVDSTGTTVQNAEHLYTKNGVYTITATIHNEAGDVERACSYNTYSGEQTTEPVAKISGNVVTEDTAKILTLSASGSSNAATYKWYKGTAEEGTQIGSNITVSCPVADLTDGQVFTLVITNSDGVTDSTTYTYHAEDATAASDKGGFFDEHGWLFIVFIVLGIVMFMAAYFGLFTLVPGLKSIPGPVFYILGIGMIVLAGFLFQYVDFDGIMGAFKGSE